MVPVIFVIKSVAVILVLVVVPVEIKVARPIEPDVLLIVATPVSDELQKTSSVTSSSVPGLNIAVALYCSCVVVPREMT